MGVALLQDWPSAAGWPRTGPVCSRCPPRRAGRVLPAPGSGQAGSSSLDSKVRTKCEPEGKKSPMKTYDADSRKSGHRRGNG